MVYACWDRSKHIRDYPKVAQWKRAWIGIDNGFAAPFAALLGFEDTEGRVMIVAERYGSGLRESERVGKVHQLISIAEAARVPLHKVVCDSAAADFINALRESGIPCQLANKAVDDGIAATRARDTKERQSPSVRQRSPAKQPLTLAETTCLPVLTTRMFAVRPSLVISTTSPGLGSTRGSRSVLIDASRVDLPATC
jgi:hypothetical protein